MATQTDERTTGETDARSTGRTPSGTAAGASGTAAGLVGGIVMGAVLTALVPAFLTDMVPALYDLQGSIAGWFAHSVHSVLFGAGFALLVTKSPLRGYADSVSKSTAFGVGWGIVLWVVATGVVMPIWLGLTHFTDAPIVPYLRPSLFVAHLVYGLSVGVLVRPLASLADSI